MIFSQRILSFFQTVARALESRVGRRVFWALVAATFVVMGVNTVWRAEFPRRVFVPELRYATPMEIGEDTDLQAEYRSSEFCGFRRIAWGAVVARLDPYEDLAHIRAYPPFFAIAFFPFAVVWKLRGVGSTLFFLVSFGFALLSAWVASRWVGRTRGKGNFGLFALVFILIAPLALNVIARCESDMLVLFPVSLAFLWLVQGRKKFWAGALLGFAASFKVLPGLFGVYLLCRRQWRAAAGTVAVGLVCTVLLPVAVWGPSGAWELHKSWYRNVVAPYRAEGPGAFIGRPYRASNQSLSSALHRYLRVIPPHKQGALRCFNFANLSEATVDVLVEILHILIGVGLLVLWLVSVREGESPVCRAALLATVSAGILLMSQVALTSHHVLLLLPIAALLGRMLGREDEGESGLGWVVVFYMVMLLGLSADLVKIRGPLVPATLLLLAACTALALRDRFAKSDQRAVSRA